GGRPPPARLIASFHPRGAGDRAELRLRHLHREPCKAGRDQDDAGENGQTTGLIIVARDEGDGIRGSCARRRPAARSGTRRSRTRWVGAWVPVTSGTPSAAASGSGPVVAEPGWEIGSRRALAVDPVPG